MVLRHSHVQSTAESHTWGIFKNALFTLMPAYSFPNTRIFQVFFLTHFSLIFFSRTPLTQTQTVCWRPVESNLLGVVEIINAHTDRPGEHRKESI